jgi:NADH:ubiquinone reductase (H+-translocating)
MALSGRAKVLIIGAGFGGLYAAQTLVNKNVDVLVIDRHNFHTFTPLLYQVATCGLDPSEIAYPVRGIFHDTSNVRFLMGDVKHIDAGNKQITVHSNGSRYQESYDYLLISAGSVTNYFGKEDLSNYAFGLKDLNDAIVLRNHILTMFEQAAWTKDANHREALTTLVVVGGGPTGLETAGALYELYNDVLQKEFPQLKDTRAKVILIEATDRLLTPYPQKLREAALKQLTSLGVEVFLNQAVEETTPDHIRLKNDQIIPTHTLIWAAGVKASPIAEMLDVPLQRMGRVPVKPTMQVIGHEDIFVVGDMAYMEDEKGQPYPMVIQVAKQEAILASKNILRLREGHSLEEFKYHDLGIMATIGRSRAVAWLYNRIPLTGFIAWLAWLGLHLIWLLGFRNQLNVLVNWIWNYITYDRSVRLILNLPEGPPPSQAETIGEPGPSTATIEQYSA